MLYTAAQLSYLVDRGLRPDADDQTAEIFARGLVPHDAQEFQRIAVAEATDQVMRTQGDQTTTTTTPNDAAGQADAAALARVAAAATLIDRQERAATVDNDAIERAVTARIEAERTARIARADYIQTQAGSDGAVPADLVARALREDWDQARVDREFLDAVRRRAPSAGAGNGHVGIHTRRAATVQALQAGMLLRMGMELQNPAIMASREAGHMLRRSDVNAGWLSQANDQIRRSAPLSPEFERAMDAGHEYASYSLVDFCRAALEVNGLPVPSNRQEMIQRSLSTATLTAVFSAIVNLQFVQGYLEYPDSTLGWTFENLDVADFKTNERGMMNPGSGFQLQPRGKVEANHITTSDAVERYQIERYSGQFQVDDRDIIDDRLGNLAQYAPSELGRMARSLRPKLVYTALLANANMRDGVALFHSSHNNALTSSALDATTLAAAAASMARQTINGETISNLMRYLIVPASLSFAAARLINSSELLDTTANRLAGNANPHEGRFQLRSEPLLDNGVGGNAGSLTTWFGAGEGGSRKTIEVGFLRGTGGAPSIESFMLTGGAWGMGWKCKLDMGVKPITWHSLIRATA
jgi:hypothetical protein